MLWIAPVLGYDGDKITMTESKPTVALVQLLGCPVQPDLIEALLERLNLAGRAPIIPLNRDLRFNWLLTENANKGWDPGVGYEQAEFADAHKRAEMHRESRLPEASSPVQRGKARWDGQGSAAIPTQAVDTPVHPAGVAEQVHSAHESTPRLPPIASGGRNLWEVHSRRVRVHSNIFKERACVATQTSSVAVPITLSSVI